MFRSLNILLVAAVLVVSISGCAFSADLSRAILLDVPEREIELQFGKLPPSQLTREDSLAIASYRFTGDSVRVLAILVEWSDRPGTYSKEDFDSLLFSRGFLPDGSVADYFCEVSYGQVTETGEVFDWYNAGSWDPAFWLVPIFETLDPVIDYSQFDGDDNGDVDVAVLIRSGNGEEDSQEPERSSLSRTAQACPLYLNQD